MMGIDSRNRNDVSTNGVIEYSTKTPTHTHDHTGNINRMNMTMTMTTPSLTKILMGNRYFLFDFI